jgi:hypothetical protein
MRSFRFAALLLPCFILLATAILAGAEPKKTIKVERADTYLQIDTDALQARVRTKGYVSGIAANSFLDKKTGARDLGFGLHIMDFLMAPGWRDDGYPRDPKLHGELPKHYVEGPQICTQAKELKPEVVKDADFVAVRVRYTFNKPGKGYKAGSTWEQTLVFQPGVRYVLSCERITSANDVDDLFYRIDMPGHVRHKSGDNFTQIYLSYLGEPLRATEFQDNFGPDAKYRPVVVELEQRHGPGHRAGHLPGARLRPDAGAGRRAGRCRLHRRAPPGPLPGAGVARSWLLGGGSPVETVPVAASGPEVSVVQRAAHRSPAASHRRVRVPVCTRALLA